MERPSRDQQRPASPAVTTARVNRSLADPIRIRVFDALSRGPSTVSQLAERLGLPADRLYYHLNRMEEGGIVRLRSVRPKRVYELAPPLEEGAEPVGPGDRAGLAGAVLEAARVEAQSVLHREDGDQQLVLAYSTVEIAEGDLDWLRSRMTDLLAEASERRAAGPSRRARVVFAAYLLNE